MTASDLWVLLDRGFRRRRPRECTACAVPLPFPVNAANGGANWELDIPAGCGHRCEFVLQDLVLELQETHELSPE